MKKLIFSYSNNMDEYGINLFVQVFGFDVNNNGAEVIIHLH